MHDERLSELLLHGLDLGFLLSDLLGVLRRGHVFAAFLLFEHVPDALLVVANLLF